jgi:hypothetical protein
MTTNLEKFTRDLNQLLEGRSITTTDLALQTATVLLSLDFDSESMPPADLRTRWVSSTKPATIERKSLLNILRARPFAAILIALLILLILSGVAYAIGRSLGYIPGMGIVEQTVPFRVLAEPVSVTRDGLTIAVKEAVLSADKTIAIVVMEKDGQNWGPCLAFNELRLSDGKVYNAEPGSNAGDGTNGMHLTYAPLPASVNEATLLALPCLPSKVPGTIPEKWEFPLHFVPAPLDMTVMPVIESTLSPIPVSSTDAAVENPLSITKVIEAGDAYILIGEFAPPAPVQAGDWSSRHTGIKLNDTNGQEVTYDILQDIELPVPNAPHSESWAIKFSKGFASPLHIAYSNQYIFPAPSQQAVDFEFDAGQNPTIEQVFSQEIELVGHPTQVSIHVTKRGYFFDFSCPDGAISSVRVEIPGYTITASGGGGEVGGGGETPSGWSVWMDYSDMPKGKIKVILSDIWIYGEIKTWTTDWQP